jgi:Archaea bacterial proteins of unknown function.
LKTW